MGKPYRVLLPASRAELARVLARLEDDQLNEHDRQLLIGLLQQLLGSPSVSSPAAALTTTADSAPMAPAPDSPSAEQEPKQRRGHGRLDSADYLGARRVVVPHAQLQAGDGCPDALCRGRLFDTREPTWFVRFTGQPLVGATRYEQQVLRCSRCLQRYTAPLPDGVPAEKYDPTADVALVMAKYATGLPFYRLARLQQACGIPLSESVQWERCEAVADALLPVYLHLRWLASRAAVLVGDDTRVQILSCQKENQTRRDEERRGLHTTGIVAEAVRPPHAMVLYTSGRRHAGENVGNLLRARPRELAPPLQVGDALAANWSHTCPVIAVKCLAHARRHFTDIEEIFPDECRHVREALASVYRYEAETKTMTPDERLTHHQRHSAPVMVGLRSWIEEQFQQRHVEPNSVLGQALAYLRRHWEGLTQFLRQARAPLDSNVVERALKRVVLHRKNALFFRTEHGAAVGDILMSVIETCRANSIRAWDYLLDLVRNARAVRDNPSGWLPWTYVAETAP